MNDTCQTTAHSGDSLFSDMEDSGCQSADVPLAGNAEAGSVMSFRPHAFCGGSLHFSVNPPRVGALVEPELMIVGACRCGMVNFPA